MDPVEKYRIAIQHGSDDENESIITEQMSLEDGGGGLGLASSQVRNKIGAN